VNAHGVQPAPSRKAAVVHDGSLEKVNNLGMVGVEGAVARLIEGREACCMLAEFMGPKGCIGVSLVDPELEVKSVSQEV
jgi:hypothetical protein